MQELKDRARHFGTIKQCCHLLFSVLSFSLLIKSDIRKVRRTFAAADIAAPSLLQPSGNGVICIQMHTDVIGLTG